MDTSIGRPHWVTWSRGEQQAGSLLLALQPEGVVLTYRYRVGGGDWESMRQVVTLDWTPCHYGGAAALVPVSGLSAACGRAVWL